MIVCFTGKQGQGKTFSMVRLVCTGYLQQGKDVYSNVGIIDPVTGRQPIRWDVLDAGFEELMSVRESLIVLDDVATYLNSRTYQRRSTREFFAMLAQARKRHNALLLTAQSFDDVDVWLRRQTHTVVHCRAVRHPWRRDPSGTINPLTGRTLRAAWFIRQTILEPGDAETSAETRRKRRTGARWVRLDSRYAAAYDSWADVGAAGEAVAEGSDASGTAA